MLLSGCIVWRIILRGQGVTGIWGCRNGDLALVIGYDPGWQFRIALVGINEIERRRHGCDCLGI